MQIKHQDFKLNGIHCFKTFYFTIGRNGKLKSLEVSKHSKPKLGKALGLADFMADKRKLRQCKAKIRHLLRKVDLGFLHLKYDVYRSMNFWHDDIQLSDNTIY